VGWDIHSRIELDREGDAGDAPTQLGALLDHCTARNPDLQVYVLNWDFAMIYAFERELFTQYRIDWGSNERVHCCVDGNHPTGASQHQKFVVIDDALAFTGGFDLAQWRWDSRDHRPGDPRRRDPRGRAYAPFHDIQIAVSGAAAQALGDLARERWRGADGCETRAPEPLRGEELWPDGVPVDLEDVDVALALTRPAWGGARELRQVEQLFLDSIERARDFIYIENQYFTAHRISRALEESLEEPRGPQIVMILPAESGGWLERHTMDVLRSRLLRRLRSADLHDRLRVYYPRLEDGSSVLVHAKTMIIDDTFLRIGSANLSNRSMGLDTECDTALDLTDRTEHRPAIRRFRQGLLAEHLGVGKENVEAAEAEDNNLIGTIEALREGKRTLVPLAGDIPDHLDRAVPDSAVIDPEQPIEPQALLDYVVRHAPDGPTSSNALRLGLAIAAIVTLAALWRWTPLSEFLQPDRIEAAATWIKEMPLSPLLIALAFIGGSFAAVPLTLMIVGTVAVFGPWHGFAYSLISAEVAAVLTFFVGRRLQGSGSNRVSGSRLNTIRRRLAEQGVVSVAFLRIVPVAPFTVINIAAGASRLSLRDYALGSFLGMIPGTLAIALLVDRVADALTVPDLESVLKLGAAAVVIAGAALLLRAAVRRLQARPAA